MVWPNVSNQPLPVYIAPNQPNMAPPVMQEAQQMPPQSQPLQAPPPLSDEDLKQIREIVPDVDPKVIKTVYEASNGDKDRTIDIVLKLTEN